MPNKPDEIKSVTDIREINAGHQGKPVKIDVKEAPKSPPPPKPKEQ